MAYAIGKQLGFEAADVAWTVEPFNSSYAPGAKKFDFDVNQISITPARAKRVDFSAPYSTAPQAVVLPKGSQLGSLTSLADLEDAQIGVQIGTTSLDAVQSTVRPSKQPKVFNDSNDVVTALTQNQVDAIVVDLPTASRPPSTSPARRSRGRRSPASSARPAATTGVRCCPRGPS